MKQKINSFFDGVTPEVSNQEFLKGVYRKAENMKIKKKNNLRPLAITAAAAAVLTVGVTAAGATGLLDFNKIFGGFITAQNAELGESLVAGLEDFEYNVSDPDYIIVPNGITGYSCNYILSFDIRRVDGKPVADYLARDVFGEQLTIEYIDDAKKNGVIISRGGGIDSVSMNDEGNITVVASRHSSEEAEGSRIRFIGSNLYVIDEMIEFRNENNVVPVFADSESIPIDLHNIEENQPLPLCETEYYEIDNQYTSTHNDVIITDIDDSLIRLLDLDWNFSFRCTLSDTAAQTLHAVDVTEKAIATDGCVLTDIEISGTGGILTYHSDKAFSIEDFRSFNRSLPDIRLITADGKELSTRAESCGGSGEGSSTMLRVLFWNRSESGNNTAVSLDEITAVSVNGIVYQLE